MLHTAVLLVKSTLSTLATIIAFILSSHPHPLERPESAWLCTSAETTSPRELMNARRSSLVVPHDRLPTKTVLLTGATAATTAVKVMFVATWVMAVVVAGAGRRGRRGGGQAGRATASESKLPVVVFSLVGLN